MTHRQKTSLVVLRITMGWFMFYAGITKVLDPAWSAEGYIKGAKNFVWLYELFLHPVVLPIVNFLNAWGLTLLGVSLILGLFIRWSTIPGVALMLLYYLAILDFPYPNSHALIVDEHIIYSLVLLLFFTMRVGEWWGLDRFIFHKKVN